MVQAIGNLKHCTKCKQTKPLVEFYHDGTEKDLLTCWCRPCCKASKKNWRLNNKDKIREISRNYFNHVPRGRYIYYRKAARRTGRVFTLTFEQFLVFWKQPCTYCGSRVKTIGLDRINNAVGYTIDNVASCCAMCNFMKRSWSQKVFLKQCIKIAKTQRRIK